MKKLLLLPTILVLVSCQPSELDRCIEAESKYQDLSVENLDTYININKDYRNVHIVKRDRVHLQQTSCESYGEYMDSITSYDYDYDCNGEENVIILKTYDGFNAFPALIDKKYIVDVIKENSKEKAKEACHMKGIY